MERKKRNPRTTIVTPVRFFYFHGLYLCANDLCKCAKEDLNMKKELLPNLFKKAVAYLDKQEELCFIPTADASYLVESFLHNKTKIRNLGRRIDYGENVCNKNFINIQQEYFIETFSEDEKQEEQFY